MKSVYPYVLVLFSLLFISQNSFGAKKYYISKKTANGYLYFINPQEYISGKDKADVDLTILDNLSNQDTSFITISLFSKEKISKVTSLKIASNDAIISSTDSIEKIYIEKNKNLWEQRIRVTLPINIINNAAAFFTIIITKEDGTYSYVMKKQNPEYNESIEIIKLNMVE